MLDNKNIFNINPYYDDFEEDKGFLRILFKPGYPVQARELTQAQSILQNQISSISDHIFKNGSRVLGGTIGIRTAQYIKVDVSLFAIGTDYSSFVGARVYGLDSWQADVITVVAPSKFDLRLTLILNVISGDITRIPATLKDSNGVSYDMNIVVGGFGVCKSISLSSGVYYINGMFVIAESQTFSPYKNEISTVFDEGTNNPLVVVSRDFSFAPDFNSLTKKIGFRIISSVVSYVEDNSIRDPAQKTGNYNAPGADRYKIKLQLDQEDVDVFSSDFIELMRFDNGKITKRINRVSYGEIEKALNIRTFEESGSYTVSPFDLNVSEIIPNGLTLDYVMGSGKAYVYGQQINSQYSKIISVPKARTFTTENSVNLACSLGNYLNVKIDPASVVGGITFINKFYMICSGSSRVKFMDNSSTVADGFVHACLPDQNKDQEYRVYLHGISGSIDTATKLDVYLQSDSTKTVSFVSPLGATFAFGNFQKQNLQSLVFPVSPGYAIKEVKDITFTTKISSNNLTPNNGYVFQTTGLSDKTIINIQSDKITETITTLNNSISFVDYGEEAGSDDLDEIFVINSLGKIFRPATHTSSCLLSSSDNNTFTLTIPSPPAGFTSGVLRLVFPIKYTLSGNDYKQKIPSSSSQTFYSFSMKEGKYTLPLENIDVYSITNITQQGVDISDKFELDDGQHETYYAKSFLIKKNLIEMTITDTTPITVQYEYFIHSGLAFSPFLGKISYPNTSYEKIPLHVNPRNGTVVSLANCLDFRSSDPSLGIPILKTFGISEFGGVDAKVMTKYTHYLPRVDRVCVKADSDNSAEFFVLQGVPDMSPSAPIETNNSLTLYTIAVPAYTHNASDVSIVQNATKRYTMSEISNIEKRIDDIEIFSKLSIVENETNSRQIGMFGVEPLKTSIYIDEFYGHSKADVSSFDHICSVDYERGELRPFFESKFIQSENWSLSNTVRSIDGIITLSYIPYAYLENLQWNKKITINPSSVVSWQGFAKITNESGGDFSNSSFFDSLFRPSVKTNTIQENNNWLGSNANNNKGFGTQWNDWESFWFGKENFTEEQDDIFRKTFELARIKSNSVVSSNNSGSVVSAISRNMSVLDSSSSRLIRASRLRNRIRKVVDSRVVDHTVVPFIKKQSLKFVAHGLKPNSTGLNLYFDGVKIVTGDVVTDQYGSCSVLFEISRNTFLTGNKIIRVSDDPNIENCTMAAEAIYTCEGIHNKRPYGINTTRVPLLRRQTVSSEIISTNPFDRDLGNDILENSQWSDPMSQTFIVDKSRNPNGLFLYSVQLYFATKHSTLPVTIQIRPTVSGVANPSVSFPFSTVVLPSSFVFANPIQPPTPTSFVFSSPIFLEPGEYSISIICNTNAYSLYSANSYSSGIESNEGESGSVGNNSLIGSLYIPSIIGELIKENTASLMFSLTSCLFEDPSGSAMLGDDNGIDDSQVISTNISSISPVGCSISSVIINNASELPIRNLENFYPDTLLPENCYVSYRLQRGADASVSPVLDSRTFCGFGIEMQEVSSYISRVVDTDFIVSNGIVIFAEVVTPQGTEVTINYRTLKNGESDIFSKVWKSVGRISEEVVSSSDLDYHEATYRISTEFGFTSYQLQIILTSPNGSVYSRTPSVRSIKSITFVE